jgi:hypothetical protein
MRRLLLLILLLLAAASRAAETAPFLDIGVGARALAMGGAGTALSGDANSVYWNPAGLAGLERREASASHAELPQGSRHDFLAYAHPTPAGAFAGAVTYLSHGGIAGRDALGRPTGDFGASDAAVSVAFGRDLGFASAGAAVKYLRSHIASAEAQGAAVDLGLRRAFGPAALGAALRNLGPGLKYDAERDELPLRAALGAAYSLPGGHTLAAELLGAPRGGGADGAVGAEAQALKNLYLRAGWSSRGVGGGSGFEAARGLSLGVGLRDERWGLSYAALPMGELGGTHRFTLAARF